MGIPDHLTSLLRNLYVGQEATLRTLYGTTDWFKIQKGVIQGCKLSPCLFNLYAEQIMRNARLDELQAGIKIGGRNVNNLRYADDTTLIAEGDEDLKHLMLKVKEDSERAGLRLNMKKDKIMAPGPTEFSSVQSSRSVMSDSLRPMNRSTPGLPVYHQLPEFTQSHAHRVGDAIQPSHPLSSASPPAPNLSQHQGLFQ